MASKDSEAKYIARALQGKLRIHLADKTVMAALANVFTSTGEGRRTSINNRRGKRKHAVVVLSDEVLLCFCRQKGALTGDVILDLGLVVLLVFDSLICVPFRHR